jgi:oligopeptide transport system permease protein
MAASDAIAAKGSLGQQQFLARRTTNLWVDAWSRLIKNRGAVLGLAIIMALVLMAIFAPLVAPRSYSEQVLVDHDKVPGWIVSLFPTMKNYARLSDAYALGADYVGRDLLSRIIWGARVSLSVAFIGPLISLLIGTIYGSISGFFGGRVDNYMMRFVDVMYAFPQLLLIILLMAFFRSTGTAPEPGSLIYYAQTLDNSMGGMFFIFVGIGVTAWEVMARLVRGQVLSIREKEYIEAARTIGATNWRIMFRHIFPNVLGPIIVAETLAIPNYIATEAFLSFIGLGVNPPTPSWGSMISDGARAMQSYPNQAVFPALALAITMFAFNFLGDGLRDAFDPRMRGTK